MQLTITGYSTALFSTWYFIEELHLLLDGGDGLTSALLQKSRKIEHVFLSHADRDHLSGLLQLNQLNARQGYPILYYPRDSGSFPALEAFTKQFDPHVSATVWKPVSPSDEIHLRNDLVMVAMPNSHVATASNVVKSLSYQLVQTKRKLRPELAHLSGPEIKSLIEGQGKDSTTREVRTKLVSYSGDTPVEDCQRWNDSQLLIHEATFLGGPEDAHLHPHGNRHSTLEEVLEMVAGLRIGKLILGHFSSRYSAEQIDGKIKQLCEKYALNLPVFRLLPGQVTADILASRPING